MAIFAKYTTVSLCPQGILVTYRDSLHLVYITPHAFHSGSRHVLRKGFQCIAVQLPFYKKRYFTISIPDLKVYGNKIKRHLLLCFVAAGKDGKCGNNFQLLYQSFQEQKHIQKNVMYLIVIVPLLKIIPFSYLIY